MNMEDLVEQIYDKRSKEYFLESYSSYQNSFYRSAIVTLWNLVICDVFLNWKNYMIHMMILLPVKF